MSKQLKSIWWEMSHTSSLEQADDQDRDSLNSTPNTHCPSAKHGELALSFFRAYDSMNQTGNTEVTPMT